MSGWLARWQREGIIWRLTIIDGDGEAWLDRAVGVADPTADAPTGLVLPGHGWQLLEGEEWRQDEDGSWTAAVCPVSAEAEDRMREELGLA